MSSAEAPNISADAGDEKVLRDPNSPEAIALRAKKAEAQSSADKQYDSPPPAPESFLDYIVVWEDDKKRSREISAGLFLALGTLLFLYKAAPNSI
jgi:hypothetical protein